MGLTRDMGRRVELVSMDPHFHDITLGLYRQDRAGRPQYLVHTYSGLPGAASGGNLSPKLRRFSGARSESRTGCSFRAGRRIKLPPGVCFLIPASRRPGQSPPHGLSSILDKKSGRNIVVTKLTGGIYQIAADGPEEGKAARLDAIVAGLRKLGELDPVPDHADQVAFSCGHRTMR